MAPAVEVERLSRSFGTIVALEDVSLHVDEGELVSLLGPNGAGKTTLIRHLYCELRPQRGSVLVLGRSPCDRSVRRRLGVTPQEAVPYGDLTVFDNVFYSALIRGLPRGEARRKTEEVVEELGLGDVKDRYVMDLSGGMKRRVLIAMALVHDPDVLVLDEPTTGLDPLARRELWGFLRRLKRAGRAILLTTHYIDEANELSDRVYFINRRVLAEGTPAELRSKLAVYYEVIDLSAGKTYKVREEEVKDLIMRLNGKFEVRLPSLEDVYLEVVRGAQGAAGSG